MQTNISKRPKLTVRVSEDLQDYLERKAMENLRSVNQEIAFRLIQSVDAEKKLEFQRAA